MITISELQKLKGWHFLAAILAFLAVVGPGFLTIFHYRPDLVEKYDVAKLLIFSASLTLPVVIAILIGTSLFEPVKEKIDFKTGFLTSSFVGCIAHYGSLGLAYYRAWPFRTYVLFTVCFAAAVVLIIGVEAVRDRKKAVNGKPPV